MSRCTRKIFWMFLPRMPAAWDWRTVSAFAWSAVTVGLNCLCDLFGTTEPVENLV